MPALHTSASRPPARSFLRLAALGLLLALAVPLASLSEPDRQTAIRLFETQHLAEARELLASYAATHPGDAEALFYLGRIEFDEDHPGRAARWLEKAASLAPGRSEVHDWLGRAYGIRASRSSFSKRFALAIRARKEFERAVETDPDNLEAREDLLEYDLEAPGFLGGGVEKAGAQAAEIRRRDALRGHLAFAEIFLRHRGLAAAERELHAAMAEAPSDPRPHLGLGAFYEEMGRYDQAFESFEAALRLDAENPEARLEIGKTAALSGRRLRRAEECLNQYLEHPGTGNRPTLASAHDYLAMVLEKRGELSLAREHYHRALDLDPALRKAREALKRLE